MTLTLETARKVENCRGSLVVVSCSSLKIKYRDLLVENIKCPKPVHFVFLDILPSELHKRVEKREQLENHFMPSSLIESQLNDLEKPFHNEGSGNRKITIIDGDLALKGVEEIGYSLIQTLIEL